MLTEHNDLHLRSAKLRSQLISLITDCQLGLINSSSNATPDEAAATTYDVIVTANEVNQRHGTGVLVRKIFSDDSSIFSIRSQNSYGGEHTFGKVSLCLPKVGLSRSKIFSIILKAFDVSSARRVLCIPYFADDILIALAVKELFDIPLCTYIMDDHNIYANGIPDNLMWELLSKSSLRLAISSELQRAYETKYNLKFWLLPPILSNHLIRSQPQFPAGSCNESKVGILIGNIWGQRWLDLLRETVAGSGIQVHWYANNGAKCPWLKFDQAELKSDGITLYDPLPEPELAERLSHYTFAILPSGTLDERDDNRSVAQLSLPTRVPFILATSSTPIIVLGSPQTAAARFIKRCNVGTVCDYNSASFRQAVADITHPDTQLSMRKNAAAIASAFSSEGVDEWIWQSLEMEEPCNSRFEKLLVRIPDELAYFVESPVPKGILHDFIAVYQCMRRLKQRGFKPNFVIDVGASTGVWSHTINRLFPDSRFILIDPLFSKYDSESKKYYIDPYSNFDMVEAAVSNESGEAVFQIASDLYGSSLLEPSDFRSYESACVQVITLDDLAKEKKLTGRGILKIDVQFAEHLVLQGAHTLLHQIDVLVVELSLMKYDERAKVFLEMCLLIHDLGFRYYDDAGIWRSPVDGTLLQKDGLFVRHELFMHEY